ncbi:F0F1 ATP synthase subunit gamma [Spelaeicoccus albus]|uniref:ATP synthase gamma chain n=1 Tax=Spelaeicoccus albus TaxID=1280376 RepID=A0A7Z0D4Y0_9MICO|nr:F0F1 ATP synthase subunit gamma [Spelaeicoccus albus]NYI68969.1 F-type H+-transporting ATPase subunit gamma [Spelaeicoccus albus]
MGAQQRVYRQKIRATASLRKIFKAMELIAASRIQKAQDRVHASSPYSKAINRAVSAVATQSRVTHTLTNEPEQVRRAGVIIVGSDRGFAGAYTANVIREAEGLVELLKSEDKDVALYAVGGKVETYYHFRGRELKRSWGGFSELPQPRHAREIGEGVLEDFLTDYEDGGLDEIHLVYTKYVNMVTQEPQIVRLLPLEVVDAEEKPADDEVFPLYEFEPGAEHVLDSLLPRYIESRIFNALLQAAASYQAARQRAMKSAADNADDLIKTYTRLANTARQAEITQEITEIVGGVEALAASGAEEA